MSDFVLIIFKENLNIEFINKDVNEFLRVLLKTINNNHYSVRLGD